MPPVEITVPVPIRTYAVKAITGRRAGRGLLLELVTIKDSAARSVTAAKMDDVGSGGCKMNGEIRFHNRCLVPHNKHGSRLPAGLARTCPSAESG